MRAVIEAAGFTEVAFSTGRWHAFDGAPFESSAAEFGTEGTAIFAVKPVEPQWKVDMLSTGRSFVQALTNGDYEAVRATLADGVRLRMLLPRGPDEVRGAGAAARTFARWFGGAQVPEVEASAVDRVADRLSVSYRLRVLREDGWRRVEQHLFAAVDEGGRMETIDLLCTGFRPLEEPLARVHQFDAGDLGCADGLADEFRRRIQAIPVGEVLAVAARDPAAKEDLPALARLMGHAVRSVEAPGDGRLVITVERGR